MVYCVYKDFAEEILFAEWWQQWQEFPSCGGRMEQMEGEGSLLSHWKPVVPKINPKKEEWERVQRVDQLVYSYWCL